MYLKNKLILVSKIFFSQIFITALNTISSILLLRLLSLDEFSTYVLITTYISIVVTFSDMGISQSLVSIGSLNKSNISFLISISETGLIFRKKIFFIFFTLIAFFIYITNYRKLDIYQILFILIFIFFLSSLQGIIQIKKTIFIINYDTYNSFKIGLIESTTKLVILPLCYIYPKYQVALLGLLFSSLTTLYYIHRFTRNFILESNQINISNQIVNFIKPLVPVVIFTVIQGNLGIILLDYINNKNAVAQFGALNRISMIFSTLLVFNNYIIQPYFANLKSLKTFKIYIFNFCTLFMLFSMLVLLSIYYFSDVWLFILGKKYSNLRYELFLVALNSLINLFGASIYTILISKKFTKGQSYYIFWGILINILYYFFIKISNLNDILFLNILMSISYLLVQFYYLKKLVLNEF